MAYSTTSDISELLRQTTLEGDMEEVGGAELGRGAYGRVFTVIYSGSVYAAKEIHPILYEEVGVEEKEAVRRNFLRECYYCSTLSHPNIVRFIGIYYPPHKPLHLPIMIMEMMNSSLTSLIRSKPNLDMTVKNSILLDVACGLHYLHSRSTPVIHRDLSPNNIMLSSQLMAKIGDLGVANAIRADSRRTKNKLTSAPGTTDFMPPEALHDNAVYDTSLDVFSFGGIIIYVITEEWPTPKAPIKFDKNTRRTRGFNEVERRQDYLDKITGNYTLKSLIERCLDNDPNVRPSISAIIKTLKVHDGAQINIVLTGITGSGKSAVGNFFLKKEVFCAAMKFSPVTTRVDCAKGIVGGKLIQFIDTPGLLDEPDGAQTDLAKSIIATANGIHALGIVIKIGNRVTSRDTKLYENILAVTELTPYVFLIFSHAYHLGVTHEEQQHNFKEIDCKILHKLLKNTENRYIILESVLNKEKGYYDLKADKLVKIVDSILDKQKKPFTCFLTDMAKSLLQSKISQKECIEFKALLDLKPTKEECKENENIYNNFRKNYFDKCCMQ